MYGWGDNKFGQLGLNEEGREEGIMECPTPTLIDTVLDFNFKRATCGTNHTALLEENGNLIAFGANSRGQVGVKNNLAELNQRSPLSVFQVLRMNDNQSLDESKHGEEAEGSQSYQYVIDVHCNGDTTVCLTDENEVYAWGASLFADDSSQFQDEPIVLFKVSDQTLNPGSQSS